MGQAESTTLTRRATISSTKIASEVDIEDHEGVPSYFSATMIVIDGNNKAETLMPITSFAEGVEEGEATGGVSNAFYCVQKGQCFWIKCNLLRPPPPGISFGARVYVDSGATNFGAYTRAGSANGDSMGVVDTAEFDHYFWPVYFPTCFGFYRDSETSYPFTFDSTKSDLPISCDNEDDTNISHYYIEAANSVGAVRIQFAKVKKWLHRKKTDSVACLDAKKRRLNGESALACLADAKGVHVAARPADMHTCDGQSTTVDMEAVLSPEVLFECRLFYNDFAGYRKQASVGSAMSSHYQCHYGCIDTFLRALQRGQMMIETEVRLVALSQNVYPAQHEPYYSAADNATNKPVPIAVIVDAISRTLSPAASFCVCVGIRKEGNYGEGDVQSFAAAIDPSFDREEKIKATEVFFTNRPDLYNLQPLFEQNSKENNRPTYGGAKSGQLSNFWFPKMRGLNKKKKQSSSKLEVASFPCHCRQPALKTYKVESKAAAISNMERILDIGQGKFMPKPEILMSHMQQVGRIRPLKLQSTVRRQSCNLNMRYLDVPDKTFQKDLVVSAHCGEVRHYAAHYLVGHGANALMRGCSFDTIRLVMIYGSHLDHRQ